MSLRARSAALLLVAPLAVVGCARPADGGVPPDSTSTARPVDAPPGLEGFYGQRLQWGSCQDFESPGDPLPSSLDCARLTVPIDYAHPDGPTAQLAVSRSKASGQRIGSLVTNPGGPGVSGLSLATAGARTALADRFDVIGLDPRGVGASTPTVRCLTPAETDAERADPDFDMSPQGIERTEDERRQYADRCVQRSGADLLAHVGTREVVQDLDVLRAALGDDKLTYLGYSYGTRIGLAYAERYPQRVRAMVLDGVVDPGEDPVRAVNEQAAGFQQAFDQYAADCARSDRCPLGQDPAGAAAAFRALLAPLQEHPARTTDPRGLGYEDAITGVQQALYGRDLWQLLTTGLRELADGRGDTLLHLADLYEGRRDDGSYANVEDAFNAVRCVDDPRVTDRAVAGAADAEYRKAAPFLDDGMGTGQAPLDLCAFWPVPNSSTPQQVVITGAPRLVVVSTTGDPATPYQAGADLAKQIGAALITYQGTRHTIALTSGERCVDDPVIDYLIDLTPPADGLTCATK